jgi:hypothetical protein
LVNDFNCHCIVRNGFDYAAQLAGLNPFLFAVLMLYMCVTSFGMLNGLVGIFGTAFTDSRDTVYACRGLEGSKTNKDGEGDDGASDVDSVSGQPRNGGNAQTDPHNQPGNRSGGVFTRGAHANLFNDELMQKVVQQLMSLNHTNTDLLNKVDHLQSELKTLKHEHLKETQAFRESLHTIQTQQKVQQDELQVYHESVHAHYAHSAGSSPANSHPSSPTHSPPNKPLKRKGTFTNVRNSLPTWMRKSSVHTPQNQGNTALDGSHHSHSSHSHNSSTTPNRKLSRAATAAGAMQTTAAANAGAGLGRIPPAKPTRPSHLSKRTNAQKQSKHSPLSALRSRSSSGKHSYSVPTEHIDAVASLDLDDELASSVQNDDDDDDNFGTSRSREQHDRTRDERNISMRSHSSRSNNSRHQSPSTTPQDGNSSGSVKSFLSQVSSALGFSTPRGSSANDLQSSSPVSTPRGSHSQHPHLNLQPLQLQSQQSIRSIQSQHQSQPQQPQRQASVRTGISTAQSDRGIATGANTDASGK